MRLSRNVGTLTCDEFLAGPDRYSLWNEGEVKDLYRVNDIHERLVCDILDEHPADRAAEIPLGPAAGDEGFRLSQHAEGIILRCHKGRIAGVYLGLHVALHPGYRGRGLGTDLIVARYLVDGQLPGWSLEPPLYTRAGLRAHRAAWRTLQDPLSIVDREGWFARTSACTRDRAVPPSPVEWQARSCIPAAARA